MAKEVRLPKFSETMEEGIVVNALVSEGDEVKKGDCIFEIETDKATIELESPADGFVKKILVETGQVVSVDTAIMVLANKDEKISQSFIDSLKAEATPAVSAEPAQRRNAVPVEFDEIDTSPVAQAQAIADGAAIRRRHYELGQKVVPSRLHRIVGQQMLQSKREIPCFYLNTKADITELLKLQARLNETGDVEMSFDDFIIRATALALKRFPIMTGRLADDFIQLAARIGIGLTIAVDHGQVAPVVKDADTKTVAETAACRKELIARTTANKLSPDDLEGACITLSNLGEFGVDLFIPIVVPGQCSILGLGRTTDTCVLVDGNITVRKLVNLTLSVDHKVVNGADAAQFLDCIKQTLENTGNFV